MEFQFNGKSIKIVSKEGMTEQRIREFVDKNEHNNNHLDILKVYCGDTSDSEILEWYNDYSDTLLNDACINEIVIEINNKKYILIHYFYGDEPYGDLFDDNMNYLTGFYAHDKNFKKLKDKDANDIVKFYYFIIKKRNDYDLFM